MEYGGSLEFSKAILNNELTRMYALTNLIKDSHVIKKGLKRKIKSVETALLTIQGGEFSVERNFDYAITILRANLNWLQKQAPYLESTQEVIDEIEYVTKLLKNERTT